MYGYYTLEELLEMEDVTMVEIETEELDELIKRQCDQEEL